MTADKRREQLRAAQARRRARLGAHTGQVGRPPQQWDHGTPQRYRTGCRCHDCRSAQADKIRNYRASTAIVSVGSLCSGYDGLYLAARGLWTRATPAWHAETDPYASEVLAAHWPDVPNFGDITTTDWSAVPPVDVLTAGYPCPPFSTAGKRLGTDDPRYLWPDVIRAVRDLRPRVVLLENVAGHLALGFGRVLGDLAEAGFDAEWVCVRASQACLACHGRPRVFVVAYPQSADGRGPELADLVAPAQRTAELGERVGAPGAGGPFGRALDRWAGVVGRPAPPASAEGLVNPRFVEWMQGLPDGWVTGHVPPLDALRILGNGVVPQQAEAAYRELMSAL